MGNNRSKTIDWTDYIATTVSKATNVHQIYTSRTMKKNLSPRNIVREARDSDTNPISTPIIVGLDVTGSMSDVLESMAREGLVKLATEIYDRKPVQGPQVMCAGIGDAFCDDAPLQVTQFECDITLLDQLRDIYLEGGGGGNDSEGYILLWYFLAKHAHTDAWDKRRQKGYVFTVGDDGPTPKIIVAQAEKIFGDHIESDLSFDQVYKMVSEKYHVFHITVEHQGGGNDFKHYHSKWQEQLGERAIYLTDYRNMGELITSVVQTIAGEDFNKIVQSWNGQTGLVIQQALNVLAHYQRASGGLVHL